MSGEISGQEEARVRVAPPEQEGAAPVVERRLDERAGVEGAQVVLAVQLLGRRDRLAGDDAAREAPEARGVPARVEVDAVDERGVDDRRTDADVEEVRDADAVEVVADVAGRGAADVEVGQPRDDRRDARHDLDGAERVAEDAGNLADLGARERGGARRLFVGAADERPRSRLGRGRGRRRGRGRGRAAGGPGRGR